ncbi:hypothetical protein V6R98_02460 [Agrobacterium sp. CCNWLW71]|uniref:PIN domain-containing protein n=1 Tax=unclassified Agrobacterium TaxID=2632611 RepID=UPI002FF37BFA
MAATTGTQISKPAKEQDFEDNCVVLWKCILNDPSVQKVGRRGQKQKGVDLYGYRDRKRDQLVGLQCKLKTGNRKLTEKEVRDEFNQALTFEPTPTEYYILTTADDDQKLQALARKLAAEQAKKGLHIAFYIWGWGTISDEVAKHPQALDAFDPTFGTHSKMLLEGQEKNTSVLMDIGASQSRSFHEMERRLIRIETSVTERQLGGPTAQTALVELHFDRQIDGYREMANGGKPKEALTLFEQLLDQVKEEASGRILFRIKANIGNCLLKVGRIDDAADMLLDAYDHAPDEPKALPNMALGLLLKGRWEEVLELGRKNLIDVEADEYLSANVVQAAKNDPAIVDPLALIPQQHREKPSVAVAHVEFLRSRNAPDWQKTARAAFEKFPEEHYLRQFVAEAELDEATTDPDFSRTGILTASVRSKVENAADVLRSIWDDAKAVDGGATEEAFACLANLLLALRMLGRFGEAADRAQEGINYGASSPDFVLRAAIVALELGSSNLDLGALLPKLEESPSKQLLQSQFLLATGNWKELGAYTDEDVAKLPEAERLPFGVATQLARIANGPKEDVAAGLQLVLDTAPDDLRGLTVIADFGMMLQQEQIADMAYEKAKSLVGEHTHYSGRHMLAKHARRRHFWSDVVDLSLGYVDLQLDSPELRDLAMALANERPPRQRGVNFFKSLPRLIRQLPLYRHAEGFLQHARGDLKAAEECMRDALPGKRADDLLLLLSILREGGRDTEAEELLRNLSISEVIGVPSYLMAVAQELLGVGRTEEALKLGYDLARTHRNDPDVALKYSGLMFRAFDNDAIPSVSIVGEDTAFLLDNSDDKNLWFVIEGEEDNVSDGLLSPTHPFAAQSIGHPAGYSFEMIHSFQKQQNWTIKEVKHKYLWLFHEIMENFENWYPGVNGISRFTMKGDDITPVLDQVKKSAENLNRVAELYTDKRTPLALVAAHLHRDPIWFVGYLRGMGHDIHTCVGQPAERAEALLIIERHRAAGAVLDTYTAWTVAVLGLFGVLRDVFNRVVIPRSVLHDLQAFLGEEEFSERQSMSMVWRDGQFYRHIHTREDFEARRDFVREKIELIERECQIVAVDAPASTDGLADKLAEMFGAEPLNPAAVAGNDYVLISEDYHYRMWAEQLWAAKTTWLQPIIEFSLREGGINPEQYASWVAQLADLQHDFVSLNGPTIYTLAGDGQTTDWAKMSAALRYIGGPRADLKSHADTIVDFANLAFGKFRTPPLHVEKTLGMLLESVVRGRSEECHYLLWYIYNKLPGRARSYLIQWMKGHFLDATPVIQLQRLFLSETADISAMAIIQGLGAVSQNVRAVEGLTGI